MDGWIQTYNQQKHHTLTEQCIAVGIIYCRVHLQKVVGNVILIILIVIIDIKWQYHNEPTSSPLIPNELPIQSKQYQTTREIHQSEGKTNLEVTQEIKNVQIMNRYW